MVLKQICIILAALITFTVPATAKRMPYNENDLRQVCQDLNKKLVLAGRCELDIEAKTISIVLPSHYGAAKTPYFSEDPCDVGAKIFFLHTGGADPEKWELLIYREQDREKTRICNLDNLKETK